MPAKDRLHRGRTVVGAFLMQGWGQMANQVILILLLLIFHPDGIGLEFYQFVILLKFYGMLSNKGVCSCQAPWQAQTTMDGKCNTPLATAIHLSLLPPPSGLGVCHSLSRLSVPSGSSTAASTYHMKAASRQLTIAKRRTAVTGYDTGSLRMTLKYFNSSPNNSDRR